MLFSVLPTPGSCDWCLPYEDYMDESLAKHPLILKRVFLILHARLCALYRMTSSRSPDSANGDKMLEVDAETRRIMESSGWPMVSVDTSAPTEQG